jgi:hypothetical protein
MLSTWNNPLLALPVQPEQLPQGGLVALGGVDERSLALGFRLGHDAHIPLELTLPNRARGRQILPIFGG